MRGVKRLSVGTTVLLPAVLASVLTAPPGIWLDVPFVRQQKNGCGAACISMVMQYWLKKAKRSLPASSDARQIQRTLYNRKAKGIEAVEMQRYFRENGYRVFVFRADWSDLKDHLSKGRPLIVCLAGPGRRDPLHYVVVVGLDWQEQVVLVNDPAQRKLLKMDRTDFEKRWKVMGRWTLLALPRLDL